MAIIIIIIIFVSEKKKKSRHLFSAAGGVGSKVLRHYVDQMPAPTAIVFEGTPLFLDCLRGVDVGRRVQLGGKKIPFVIQAENRLHARNILFTIVSRIAGVMR